MLCILFKFVCLNNRYFACALVDLQEPPFLVPVHQVALFACFNLSWLPQSDHRLLPYLIWYTILVTSDIASCSCNLTALDECQVCVTQLSFCSFVSWRKEKHNTKTIWLNTLFILCFSWPVGLMGDLPLGLMGQMQWG